MAVEDIGVYVPTKIPTLGSDADIQTALRIYHYGSEDFSFNTPNIAPPENSIAWRLADLDERIGSVEGASGIDAGTINAKGDLIVGTANNTYDRLGIGTNGYVLTADSATTTGLSWKLPDVSLNNSVTLTNKTLTSPKINQILDANTNEIIIFTGVSNAVNEVTISSAATGNGSSISSTGGDTNIDLLLVAKGTGVVKADGIEVATISGTQTLTNKTIESFTKDGYAVTIPTITATDSVVLEKSSQLLESKKLLFSSTTFTDNAETSKVLQFSATNLPTGITSIGFPSSLTAGTHSLVFEGFAQTLSNKTLVSPAITTSITGSGSSVSLFGNTGTTAISLGHSLSTTDILGVVKIGGKKIFVSSSQPSGGSNGDIWIKAG